jgi:hypothetical protein
MEIRTVTFREAAHLINTYHYSHRTPNMMHTFGLYDNGKLEGCVTYGLCSSPQVATSIYPIEKSIVLELNRLVITSKNKNAASFLVGNSLKKLPSQKIIVSYADGAFGHIGYVYQATNFWYAGNIKSHDSEYLYKGKKYHPRTLASMGFTSPTQWAKKVKAIKLPIVAKHRYVYFTGTPRQKKKLRKEILWEISMDYPKGKTDRHESEPKEISLLEIF